MCFIPDTQPSIFWRRNLICNMSAVFQSCREGQKENCHIEPPALCMNVRETHIVFFYHVLHTQLYHLAEAVQVRSSDPVRWSSGRKFRERGHLQDEMAVCVYAITCVCFSEY